MVGSFIFIEKLKKKRKEKKKKKKGRASGGDLLHTDTHRHIHAYFNFKSGYSYF